jgi:hypothetical protein
MHVVIKRKPRPSANSPQQQTEKQFHADHLPLPQAQMLNFNQLSKFSPQSQDGWGEQSLGVLASAHGSVTPGSSADCASLAPLRIKIPFNGFTALEVQLIPPASARTLFVLLERDRSRLGPLAITLFGTARPEARV